MKIDILKKIVAEHEIYWKDKSSELKAYDAAYRTEFWDEKVNSRWSDSQIQIQVSEGYNYIESYMASLFAKHPAVVLTKGIKAKGDLKKSSFIANRFLKMASKTIEQASRMALIYPCSFIKLIVGEAKDVFNKVIPVAIPPWEIILDKDSPTWELQRYIGHIYYLTEEEADIKFGKKDWNCITSAQKSYLDEREVDRESPFSYVKIIELWDKVEGKLVYYSPSWKEDKWLKESTVGFPFKDFSGEGIVPIIPFYFNSMPDSQLEGYSAMKRIYDQLHEINLIRTFQANGVRKASRQYIVKKGSLDEEAMAQITSGVDGLFVEVEEENLSGIIAALPQNPTPPELQLYYQTVVGDKDKGSIMAPFTRGEATKVTATEAAALAAYTSSEIGRLAKARDIVIERIAGQYLIITSLYLEEKGDVINIDSRLEAITAEDINGDFEISASDSSSTPISESIKQAQLVGNIPTLLALGVPKEKILDELVRSLGLPESFLSKELIDMGGSIPEPKDMSPEAPPSPTEAVSNPSVRNISPLLPNMPRR